MCGRFTLTATDIEQLARELAAELDALLAARYRPRYNAAPSDLHPVVLLENGRRRMVPARFGLPGRGGKLQLNARAETAERLPAFRRAFREGRCLVPVDGFFEWVDAGAGKRPHRLHRPDGGLILLAGLCEQLADGALAFAILTTEANRTVRGLHGRMPAILSAADARGWLERPASEVLRPAPDEWLVSTEVSARVNSVAHDDPACLAPPEPPRQGRLF